MRPAKNGQSYIIGSRKEKTNRDLLLDICRLLDGIHPRKSSGSYQQLITPISDRLGHDRRYASDASKLRDELGWQPTISLEQGLA